MKKVLQIANVLALLGTILVNYISNAGSINGQTISSVSSKYENLATHAGYAFSIWGLIYIGLVAFVIYQARSLFLRRADDSIVSNIHIWFILSCLANSAWVLAWLYEKTGLSVLIMIMLLLSLLQIVLKIIATEAGDSIRNKIFVRWPFAIYTGWIIVALIINVAAFITKVEWRGFGLPAITWGLIVICLAGLLNLFMTWIVRIPESAWVAAWALVAIAVANWDKGGAIKPTAIAVTAVLVISNVVYLLKKPAFHGSSRNRTR